jgi:hypothetical protein
MIHTIYREDEIIVALNGMPYTVDVEDPRYDDIFEAIENDDEEKLISLLSTKGRTVNLRNDLSADGIECTGGAYTYKGNPLPMDLTDYIMSAMDRGNTKPIVQFVQRLYENPNYDTRIRLFEFMERNKMPIDNDGRFLAFKVVTSDYMDKHTQSVSNSVSTTVPRKAWSDVDTDPTVHCSRGYHACSLSYITSFFNTGDRIVSVAIAPEDVGSIPDDYDGAKLRCRQYEVMADITDSYLADTANVRIHITSGEGLDPVARAVYESRYARDYY